VARQSIVTGLLAALLVIASLSADQYDGCRRRTALVLPCVGRLGRASLKSRVHLYDLLWICCQSFVAFNDLVQLYSKSATNRTSGVWFPICYGLVAVL